MDLEALFVCSNGANHDYALQLSTSDDSGREFRRHNVPAQGLGSSGSIDGVEMWAWDEDDVEGNWMWGTVLGWDGDGHGASIGRAVPVYGADNTGDEIYGQRPNIVWDRTDMDPAIIGFAVDDIQQQSIIPSSIHQISRPSDFTYPLSSSISDTVPIGTVQTVPAARGINPLLLYPQATAAETSYNRDLYKQNGMLQFPPLFSDFDPTLVPPMHPCDPYNDSCLIPISADESNSCSNQLHNEGGAGAAAATGTDALAPAAYHDGLMWTDHDNIEHRDRPNSPSPSRNYPSLQSPHIHHHHHHRCSRGINAFPFMLPADHEFEYREQLQALLRLHPPQEPRLAAASSDHLSRRSSSSSASSKFLISSSRSNLMRFCRSSQRRKRDIRNRKDVIIVRALGSVDEPLGDCIPPDSWTWRKYGQKPIKGSKHPRSYYRCTAVKGCKARKRVERWLVDPHMLEVTYFCDHTHLADNNNNNNCTSPTTISRSNDSK